MATYVTTVPPGALQCGTAQFVIEAPNEATTRMFAEWGGGPVKIQVEGFASFMVKNSPELARRVRAMDPSRVRVLYTLGTAEELEQPESSWYFPFTAYVVG